MKLLQAFGFVVISFKEGSILDKERNAAISHIIESVIKGWEYRNELQKLVADTPPTRTVLDQTADELACSGIKVLALDFDGVLAPHGADQPVAEVIEWLERATSVFGQEQIFILSNRPFGPRINWFATHFPALRFISGVRKKPFPDGIKKIEELTSVRSSSILMVDDRLLTGCLSAMLAGARPCYVRNPYIKLRSNLGKELFFIVLRWLERFFVRFLP